MEIWFLSCIFHAMSPIAVQNKRGESSEHFHHKNQFLFLTLADDKQVE